MEITEYKTIAKPVTVETKIQKSIFIGHTQETSTIEEAQEFITRIRAEHSQATHNCYAYIIGLANQQVSHFHDHGEPSGTAGKPILGAIQRLDLTNVTVVVTRYFGGQKLGVRGLIEAYGHTATLALEEAGLVTVTVTKSFTLELAYPNLGTVQYLLNQGGGVIEAEEYTEVVSLTVKLPISTGEQVIRNLEEKQLVHKIKEAR